jgi:high-affinity nickel-transport protein
MSHRLSVGDEASRPPRPLISQGLLTIPSWLRVLSRAARSLGGMIAVIAILHITGWLTLIGIVAPQHLAVGARTFDVGIGVTAYMLGIRHALDADHIAAIDNTTRQLMTKNERALSVGFWFAIGHSSVVFVLTVLFGLGARTLARPFLDNGSKLHILTEISGTIVSVGFLYAIAALNMQTLSRAWRQFRFRRTDLPPDDESEKELDKCGLLNRLLSPLMKLVAKPWQMYFIGLLFGLGFDTATEISLLVLSGTGAVSGLPWYAILCLPVLFASGMSIIDTIDGSLMNVAYGWGLARPAARIGYDLAVTTLSVTVALVIGTLEILGLVGDRLRLQGAFWHRIAAIDLNVVGLAIVALFMFAWGIALVTRRVAYYMRRAEIVH